MCIGTKDGGRIITLPLSHVPALLTRTMRHHKISRCCRPSCKMLPLLRTARHYTPPSVFVLFKPMRGSTNSRWHAFLVFLKIPNSKTSLIQPGTDEGIDTERRHDS